MMLYVAKLQPAVNSMEFVFNVAQEMSYPDVQKILQMLTRKTPTFFGMGFSFL